jgi:two-component system, LytTR family, response regulator
LDDPTVLRVVAIDDEPLALRRISMAIDAIPNVALIGTSRSGQAGLELARDLRPDVLLLDINMAEFDGFDVIAGLGEDPPLVIFVTAFQEHAIRAFEARAQDYLLKPLEFNRLHEALDGARGRLKERNSASRADELQAVVAALRDQRPAANAPRFETELWVPWGGSFERLAATEIDWVEAEGDYVRIHARGKTYLLRETMAKMAKRLDDKIFQRVHRSALVNQPKVERIDRPRGKQFVLSLSTGAKVPVGRNYLRQVRVWLAVKAGEAPAVSDEEDEK